MAHLVITTRCNNNCVSCINSRDNRYGATSFEHYKKIIHELEKEDHITIGGGEPTLHPRFFDILGLVDSLDVGYTILTNGRAFSNYQFMDRFKRIRNRPRIAVALYGHDAPAHDAVTRSPGSFVQTTEGLGNLIQHGFRVEIRLIVTKMNYKILPKTAKLAKNTDNYERVVIVGMKITGEARKNKNITAVQLTRTLPFVKEAVDLVRDRVFITHYPNCILGNYRKYSLGATIEDSQLYWGDECRSCKDRSRCSGVWKSYHDIFGFGEFGVLEKQ